MSFKNKPELDERSSTDNESAFDEALADSLDDNANLEAKLADAERRVLLAQADLENSRKRIQKDAEDRLKYANLPLVRDLLDVIDNLHRATGAAAGDASQTESGNQALLDGVRMVLSQLQSVLAKYGCQPIQSLGCPFDPNFHEAISQMPSDEYAAGTVAQEFAIGYLLHDRVVRPASVIVSSGPKVN